MYHFDGFTIAVSWEEIFMSARVFRIHPDNPQLRLIRQAVEVLRNGGVIVYPTDTIYGIGCSIFEKEAIERIYRIKHLDPTKPLSFICYDLSDISTYARVSNYAYRAMKRHLPGPYTFILPAAREVPKRLWNKRRAVGIRVPDNEIARLLVRELGAPIVSTSITDEEGFIISDPETIVQRLGDKVDAILDAGPLVGDPSTVVDLTEDMPQVLREGAGDVSWFSAG